MSIGPAIVTLAGGLGLFLVGLWLATEGAALSCGGGLRLYLERCSSSRVSAFVSGLAGGSIFPSSARWVRTVAGLTNTGLLALWQSLWISAGCAVGAAVFAWWLVGASSSRYLPVLALAAIAVGALFRWSGPRSTLGNFGQALLGYGVVLLGIHYLATSFAGLEGRFVLDDLGASFASRVAFGVGLGLTLAMGLRSGAASVALAMLTTSAGAVELMTGAAWVIGAHLGSVVPALFAMRTGPAETRRSAAGMLIVHALGAFVGWLVLAMFLPVVASPPGLLSDPILALAFFYVLFAVLGALLFWPLAAPIERMLEDHMAPRSEEERFTALDPRVIDVPDLALESLLCELRDLRRVAMKFAEMVLSGRGMTDFRMNREWRSAFAQSAAIEEHVRNLLQRPLPRRVAQVLSDVTLAAQSVCRLCEAAAHVRSQAPRSGVALEATLQTRIGQIQFAVLHFMDGCDPSREEFSLERCREERKVIDAHAKDLKQRFLRQTLQGSIPAMDLERMTERLTTIQRMARIAYESSESYARATAPGVPFFQPRAWLSGSLERLRAILEYARIARREAR